MRTTFGIFHNIKRYTHTHIDTYYHSWIDTMDIRSKDIKRRSGGVRARSGRSTATCSTPRMNEPRSSGTRSVRIVSRMCPSCRPLFKYCRGVTKPNLSRVPESPECTAALTGNKGSGFCIETTSVMESGTV